MIALLLALVTAALAARLEMAVDTRDLAVGQSVGLDVQVVNGRPAGPPEVPVGEGLRVAYEGQQTSQMIVNFKSTRTVRYSYALTALKAGDWQVGPVDVVVDGQPLHADPITVHVRPRTAEDARNASVTAELSDTRPYLGQVVTYTFRYRHRGQVADARWSPPTWDGFVEEKTADTAQRDYTLTEDGEAVQVEEVVVPLVAVGAGQRVIPPAVLTVQVPVNRPRRGRDPWRDAFFGRPVDTRTETLSTDPIPVEVRPLPAEGRPADFSGLVGRFALKATPSATRVALGDSVTLDVVLTGDGTLSGFSLPGAPEDAGYRVYDDQPEVTAKVVDGRFVARAHFRRAIVPEREGRVEVAPVAVTVFDPAAGRYRTLRTDPVVLEVTPGEGGGQVTSFAGATDGRRAVESLGDDILPVRGDARVGDRTLRAALPWAVALVAVPGLGLAAAWGLGWWRRRRPDPWVGLRRRLAELPSDPAERLAELEAVLREAAGLRLGRPAPAVDRAAMEELGLADLYDGLQAARYGGGAAPADLEARVAAFVREGGAR